MNKMTKPISMLMVQAWDGEVLDHFISPPLGIHRIRKWLEAKFADEVDIECFDPNAYDNGRELLSKKVQNKKYNVITFSPLHFTLENDLALMYDVERLVDPETLFIAGGQQSAFGENMLMDNFSSLDIVVLGEGEKPMTGIFERLLKYGPFQVKNNHRLLSDVSGLYLRQLEQWTGLNRQLTGEEFVYATSLVDFTDVNQEVYWDRLASLYTEEQLKTLDWQQKIYTVKPYTTNFCPMDCSFCSTTNFVRDSSGGRARVVGFHGKSLEEYINNLVAKNPKARTIMFKDDLWFIRGGGRPQLMDDLKALKRVRDNWPERSIRYTGKARVDTFVDPVTLNVDWELLNAAKESGMLAISFGVESFDNGDLEYYNKKLGSNGSEVNKLAINSCRDIGIDTFSYLILANPRSTIDSIFTTLDNSVDFILRGETMRLNPILMDLPGTTIAGEVEPNGRLGPKLFKIGGGTRNQKIRPYSDIDYSMSKEDKKYQIPGYPDRYVKRTYRLFPIDKCARDLMLEFDARDREFEDIWKEKSGVRHWNQDYTTPTKAMLLYKIAGEKGYIDRDKANSIYNKLDNFVSQMIEKREKPKNLTFA